MAKTYTETERREATETAVKAIEDWLEGLGPNLPVAVALVAVDGSDEEGMDVTAFLGGDSGLLTRAMGDALARAIVNKQLSNRGSR